MEALKNAWYVAAHAADITEAPIKRKILNEPLALFRGSAGRAIALSDLCPHRFAPLHMGKVIGDDIQCPYHGLRFNPQGACVYNPDGEGGAPPNAHVRAYPLLERYGLVWIWMGDAAQADPSRLPNLDFLERPDDYRPVRGYLHVRANYRYIIDNLVDVAHVLILHDGILSCPGLAKAPQIVKRDGEAVQVNRMAVDTVPPMIFDMMWRRSRGDYDGPMDHWAESRWDVATVISQSTGVTLSGQPREAGIETRNCHLVTPETEMTSHYFWAICRNFEMDNDALDDEVRVGTEFAFVEQDEKLLQALQENMEGREFWSMRPALLPGDSGAVQVRRTMDRLMKAEQQVATALAQAS